MATSIPKYAMLMSASQTNAYRLESITIGMEATASRLEKRGHRCYYKSEMGRVCEPTSLRQECSVSPTLTPSEEAAQKYVWTRVGGGNSCNKIAGGNTCARQRIV